MLHLRQIMGVLTPIPAANDVNRDEALIPHSYTRGERCEPLRSDTQRQ